MQSREPIGCPATGRADCILGQGITWLEAGGAGVVCAAAAAISTSGFTSRGIFAQSIGGGGGAGGDSSGGGLFLCVQMGGKGGTGGAGGKVGLDNHEAISTSGANA